jgi:hypothetical protein
MTLGFKVEHSLYPKEDTKEYSIPLTNTPTKQMVKMPNGYSFPIWAE